MSEIIIVTVNNEQFLMATEKPLTRSLKNELEAICECIDEDYEDEVDGLSTLELCEWFEKKVQEELAIILKPVGIGLELNLTNKY
ncbi:MAG: hypothetical protein ACERJ1_18000 [Halodesulfovibrio sp.]|uniref:hypothetical protein n=1 Tax=Halodesulfovibrio sp. TaxID=1912772 RepID=UPI00359D54E2